MGRYINGYAEGGEWVCERVAAVLWTGAGECVRGGQGGVGEGWTEEEEEGGEVGGEEGGEEDEEIATCRKWGDGT